MQIAWPAGQTQTSKEEAGCESQGFGVRSGTNPFLGQCPSQILEVSQALLELKTESWNKFPSQPGNAMTCNWSYLPPHLFAWCQVLRVVHSLPDKVLRGGSSFFPQMWRIVEDLNLWTVDQSLLGSKETPAQWKMSTRNDPKLCFGFGTAILSPRAPLKIRIDLVAYCRQRSTPRLLEDARPGG